MRNTYASMWITGTTNQLVNTANGLAARTHQKGGFFHDGRFATLLDVVDHYNTQFDLNLSDANKKDLVEYLKGI